MALTLNEYNHTRSLFLAGTNQSSHIYKLMLCVNAVFDPLNIALTSITRTEVANGNGYTTGGIQLSNVQIVTTNTYDAKMTADPVIFTPAVSLFTANYGILYNSSVANNPPLMHLDFGGPITIQPSVEQFSLIWNTNGIFTASRPT